MAIDDIDTVVSSAVILLRSAIDLDWNVPAGDLEWSCWETLEHMADDLFGYAMQIAPTEPPLDTHTPVAWQRRRDGGPPSAIFVDASAGNAGMLQVLEGCAVLLRGAVAVVPASTRAHHVYGISDPAGFAAMGVVEILVHMQDVAGGLGLVWAPPADVCDRALRRLFPDAPLNTDRWPTLLWATGRGSLPGRPALESWRWDGTVR